MHRGKNPPYETAPYIPITCPHCHTVFTEIKESDIKTTKASKCLKHLRICKEYKGIVVPAPEKRHKDPAIAGLMERMQEMENRISSHEAVFDVLVNEYGMIRPITDQTVGPQIKMLIDQSSTSTAIVTVSDAAQMQEHQQLLVQQRELIDQQAKEHSLQLREKAERIATLERERDQCARIVRQKQEEIDRIKAEKSTMEGNLRAQIKRQKCGSSSSLLAQAQQSHKEYYKRSRSPSPR